MPSWPKGCQNAGRAERGFGRSYGWYQLATMPITVRRNAYGRQLGSFHTYASCGALGEIPMTFIRAPYIEAIGEGVQVLVKVDDKIVAAQYGKQLALAFHPELDAAESTAVHEYFLRMCENK